jgi:hypothetical protein
VLRIMQQKVAESDFFNQVFFPRQFVNHKQGPYTCNRISLGKFAVLSLATTF